MLYCRLIWRGWRKALEYSDLTDLNQEDKSGVVSPKFEANWNKEIKKAGWVVPILFVILFF